MTKILGVCAVALLAFTVASSVQAEQVQFCDMVSFTSDLEDPAVLTLPGFDNNGGLHVLDNVTIDVYHLGSAEPAADNDDEFQGTTVRARVIRQFSAVGGGVVASGNNTVNSPFVDLTADDGDGDLFDSNPPDGIDFGVLGYGQTLAGQYFPAEGLYDGVASVDFDVTPLLMVNDLQFDPEAPDAWQLEVEFPVLEVQIVRHVRLHDRA